LKQPSSPLSISRDEIRAIYAQGEDAVMALAERLVTRITALETRVEALENQKSKDSQNSSKPPSGDGFGKRTKSLRTKSGRQSGGQDDHPGSTLAWQEAVDQVIIHPVVNCSGCGASLEAVEVLNLNCRQVHDLPPLQLVIREHQSEEKCCPEYGVPNQGAFPADVNSVVQYGSELKGLMVYLMEGQLLPSKRYGVHTSPPRAVFHPRKIASKRLSP